MVRWLVLGSGSIGHDVVQSIAHRAAALRVVDGDADRVETLRGDGIEADNADPADADWLVAGSRPDVVLLADFDASRNLRAAVAVRDAFEDVYLLAVSASGDLDESGELQTLVDRYVDGTDELRAAVNAVATGDRGQRHAGLTSALRNVSGRLGVFMHTDPDPDAIGSALALRDLAESRGLDAEACYFGEIAHQENRALVNLLELDLRHVDAETFDPGAYDGYALVDHARPGVNDGLPEDTAVDVVIDHHPPRGPVDGRFVDLRSDVGATSTLLVDYVDGLGVDIDDRVATALLYGIRVDTRDFGREITEGDFLAASTLLPQADVDVLERVESPSVSGDTFDTIGRAIKDYERAGSVVVSSAGSIGNRDAIAQAADQLLEMHGVSLTVVFGLMNGSVYASARSRASDIDVGELMRRAFADLGSAGGHADMAGAQLSVGILGDATTDDESLAEVIETVIVGRLYEELDLDWGPTQSEVEGLVADFPDSPSDREGSL